MMVSVSKTANKTNQKKVVIFMKINYIPMWEPKDILQYSKTELTQNDIESQKVIVRNFQISDDLDTDQERKYYEIYESEIFVEMETTEQEFERDILENEKLVKSYKTQKGLVNALIKSQHQVGQFDYNMINII